MPNTQKDARSPFTDEEYLQAIELLQQARLQQPGDNQTCIFCREQGHSVHTCPRNPLVSLQRTLGTGDEGSQASPGPPWTCFHCKETFWTFQAAEKHFGQTPWDRTLCRIHIDDETVRAIVQGIRTDFEAEGDPEEAEEAAFDTVWHILRNTGCCYDEDAEEENEDPPTGEEPAPLRPLLKIPTPPDTAAPGIRSLATLAQVGYKTAAEALHANGKEKRLYAPYEIILAAATLDLPLERHRPGTYDPQKDRGIIYLGGYEGETIGWHEAILCHGLIFTDGAVWRVDDFLKAAEPRGTWLGTLLKPTAPSTHNPEKP